MACILPGKVIHSHVNSLWGYRGAAPAGPSKYPQRDVQVDAGAHQVYGGALDAELGLNSYRIIDGLSGDDIAAGWAAGVGKGLGQPHHKSLRHDGIICAQMGQKTHKISSAKNWTAPPVRHPMGY